MNISTLLFLRGQRFCYMLSTCLHMNEGRFDALFTVGFRPLWQDWQSNGRTLWNRRYLDYFVHVQRPVQLNFRSLSKILTTHAVINCVLQGLSSLHLVQYFNNLRNNPELSMLMHIPMTRDQNRAVEHWKFPAHTPWYIVIEAARSRLCNFVFRILQL